MDEPEPSTVTLTRQELYERIWSEPTRLLAPQLGLSDVGLRKVCKKHRVPLPFLGYWQKLRNGQSIRRIPLRKLDDEAANTAQITFDCGRRGGIDRPLSEYDVLIKAEKSAEKQLAVPSEVTALLPLVDRTGKSIRSAKVGERGLASPKAQGCLDVTVSPAQIDRSLRIWNTLLPAFEQRGYPLTVNSDGKTGVEVLGETLSLSMEETVTRSLRPLTPAQERAKERDGWFFRHPMIYDHRPTGQIGLRVAAQYSDGCRRAWWDTRKKPLERSLNSFLAGLVRIAESIKTKRAEHEAWQRKCAEDAARRREQERRRQEEELRFSNLQKGFEQWMKAENLRRYIEAVRMRAEETQGTVLAGSDLDRWLQWAERTADGIDPLVGAASLPVYAVKVEPRHSAYL